MRLFLLKQSQVHQNQANNDLHQKLRRQLKTWNLKLTVMNHQMAHDYGLLIIRPALTPPLG